jgi:predicted short-subunit dehydrogenase-like oxidoreductase (DUF2520 family)
MLFTGSIALVGSGNVAWHLGNAFVNSGVHVSQVYGRNFEKANGLAQALNAKFESELSKLNVDVIIVCVNDDNIAEVISKIPIDCCVLYTSGALGLSAFEDRKNIGVLYPLQTFGDRNLSDFSQIPLLIEARDGVFLKELNSLASSISSKVYVVNSEQRLIYHLSAVWMNNFVNHLGSIAFEIIEQYHLNWEVLKPLIEKTTLNILNNNPIDIQTGPAKRNDLKTLALHQDKLNAEQKALYIAIAESIKKKHHPNGKL